MKRDVGDTVVHRHDPLRRRHTVVETFAWLGNRKVVAKDEHGLFTKDWEHQWEPADKDEAAS